MDDDPFDLGPPPTSVVARSGGDGDGVELPVKLRITRTEEQTSLMMQRFTAYVIDVSDFGRSYEVSHRYGDFEALHKALLVECPGLNLPPLPPKGVDGTDANVVAMRKAELEKLLKFMLSNAEVLMEKQLHFWKFLNLTNPSVIAARFAIVPRSRPSALKTLVKMSDPKYKEDVYRLAHPRIIELLMDGLRELGRPGGDSSHWANQQGGRNAACQVLSIALGSTDEARARFLEAGAVPLLLSVAVSEEAALDDARIALNVIVVREGDRFGNTLAGVLRSGGLNHLLTLSQRPKSQEFVAKLLWLAWDAPVRSCFVQPGGQGLRLLQALLQSSVPTSSLLGAVLLAGLVAGGDFNADPGHRSEAIRMVKGVLDRPDAAADPQFGKSLCVSQAALGRVSHLLDDPDLAAPIMSLLCAAKPPPAKLTKLTGTLSAIVSGRGASHSEEARARAAELLLHVQGGGGGCGLSTTPGAGGSGAGASGGPAVPGYPSSLEGRSAAAANNSPPAMTLESCEGLAAQEESIESALRSQLEEGVAKSRSAFAEKGEELSEVKNVAQQRLQRLQDLDFKSFDSALSTFKLSREQLEKLVRESQALQQDMESKLTELANARPSGVDPTVYRQRLELAERLYQEVKQQREATTAADALAKEKKTKAEEANAAATRINESHKKLELEISSLRSQKSEKETEAMKLRHRCNTPNLDVMKKQAAEALERNLAQARELQVIGQRVNQGDPDYLKNGETRESKIADLANKLAQLKKQHQVLLQQQKELEFNPEEVAERASRLESEAAQHQSRIDGLQTQHSEAERERWDAQRRASQELEEARIAQDRKANEVSRLQAMESEAKSQVAMLQPMIQESHAGWQRLLDLRKRLDADQRALGSRLGDANSALQQEAANRAALAGHCQQLIGTLQGFLMNLEEMGSGGGGGYAGSAGAATAAAPVGAGDDEFDEFDLAPTPGHARGFAPPAAAALPSQSASRTELFGEDGGDATADGLFGEKKDPEFALDMPAPSLVSAPAAQGAFGDDDFGTL